MASVNFILTGKWKRMQFLLDKSKFHGRLIPAIERATTANAMEVRRAIRDRIRSGAYSANAGLTILIKRSSKPLVDDGDLFNAITFRMIDARSAFIGIQRGTMADGEDLFNIAVTLHEGATIPVTDAMRGLFYSLASIGRIRGRGAREARKTAVESLRGRAAELFARLGPRRAGNIRPLRPGTAAIHIPARPFIRSVFEDGAVLRSIKERWQDAVDKALRGM